MTAASEDCKLYAVLTLLFALCYSTVEYKIDSIVKFVIFLSKSNGKLCRIQNMQISCESENSELTGPEQSFYLVNPIGNCRES